MRMAPPVLSGRFRDIVTRIGAVFRAQREIDAQRALRRYRHLLEQPQDIARLNEISPVSSEEDASQNADRIASREGATGQPSFERA
jgi:hypothetical protein